MKRLLPALLTVFVAACSTAPQKSSAPGSSHHTFRKPSSSTTAPRGDAARIGKDCSFYAPAQEDASTRGNYTAGGLYKPGVSDTTPDHVPDLDCIAEPLVQDLPRSPVGNRSPYSVLGKQYRVMDDVQGYVESGTASYYGNKFHGRLTSNREVYDMYAYTAAHKTLPLPSFARVTNLDNGQSVIVRVNDRGPFHEGRVIDLSYAAAVRLGITQRGTGRVEVRALTEADAKREGLARASAKPATAAAAATPPTTSGMDRMVQQLPTRTAVPTTIATDVPTTIATGVPTTVATGIPASASPAASAARYHVQAKPGDAPSAGEFDMWLKHQGVSVATGKPGTPRPRDPGASAPAAAAPQASTAAAANPPPRVLNAGVAPAALAAPLQLQVASFASRENADKAMARLVAAGIDGASLSDVQSNGRVLWRLRVGAADAARADELAGRIASLGFGRPQLVRE